MKISIAFDKTLEKFNISGKVLASQSGVSEQMISGFRNDKQQVKSDSLEKLLAALPTEAREYFAFQLLGYSVGLELRPAILSANPDELEDILMFAAERYAKLRNNARKATDEKLPAFSVI